MKDPRHLVLFLGKRVAVQSGHNKYLMLILYSILANGSAIVGTSAGQMLLVEWSRIENPHMLVDSMDIDVRYL